MAETEILSHWSHLIDGLEGQSSDEFYTKLEAGITARKMPDVRCSRVSHFEGGMFSASRIYLRVTYKEHIFDVCAAPFGTGFFISWWLVNEPGCLTALSEIPILGWFIRLLYTRETYYRIDVRLMFQSAVHAVVQEMVTEICETSGKRVPALLEFKPVMKEFFK